MRVGLHAGNSIAVTLNERLDYYGEAVNLAARLEGAGEAGEITMSARFATDPAVDAILGRYRVSRGVIELKGFFEPVAICRLNPAAQA